MLSSFHLTKAKQAKTKCYYPATVTVVFVIVDGVVVIVTIVVVIDIIIVIVVVIVVVLLSAHACQHRAGIIAALESTAQRPPDFVGIRLFMPLVQVS